MSTHNPQHSLSRVSFPKSERKAHPGVTVAGRTDPQRNISVSIIVKRKNPSGPRNNESAGTSARRNFRRSTPPIRLTSSNSATSPTSTASPWTKAHPAWRGARWSCAARPTRWSPPLASRSTTTNKKARNSIATPEPSPCPRSMPNRWRRCSVLITIPLPCRTSGYLDKQKKGRPKRDPSLTLLQPTAGRSTL